MTKIGCLAIMLVIATVCLVDNDATFPSNRNSNPDGYWFGTQNLACMVALGKKGKRAASRWTLEPTHRVVYYRGYSFEQRPPPQWHNTPEWDSTGKCPVSWERNPAGTSKRSVQSVKDFVNGYTGRFKGYNLLFNNCHHFANRLSAFLVGELN